MTDYDKLIREGNPYDRLIQNDQALAVRGAMAGAVMTQPDVEAKLRKLSQQVGVPLDSVRVAQPEMERRAAINVIDYDRLVRETPATANFLADQAPVARDDVGALTRIERVFTAGGQGIEKGALQEKLAPLHYKAMVGDITPAEQAERKRLTDAMRALEARPEKGDSPLSWFFNVAGYSGRQFITSTTEGLKGAVAGAAAGATTAAVVGQLGPQVGLPEEIITVPGAAALGGRAGFITASTVYNYKAEAGFAFDEYEGLKDEAGMPMPREVAQGAAAAVGLLNAGLETIGNLALTKLVPGLDRIIGGGSQAAIRELLKRPTFRAAIAQAGKKWLKAASIEGITEGIQELMTILGRELAEGVAPGQFPDQPAGADIGRIATAAAEGAVGGATITTPGVAVQTYSNIREVRQAQATRDYMTALGEGAEASELRKRLPEAFREFVAKAREAGSVENVYIPAEQFRQYFQSQAVDPAQVAQEVGARNYAEAVALGTDVVIPLEDYATYLAATRHHSALMNDVRLHQGDLTMREAEAFEARRKEAEAELIEQLKADTGQVSMPAVEQIKQEIMGELTGRFEPSTADAYATLYAKTIASLAQRAGIDPVELHRTYGLRVVTPMPAVLQQRGTVDTAFDPLLDRLRAGEVPTEAQAYGPSLVEFIRERGGLRPTGETRAMDENVERRAFQKKITQEDGMDLDRALEAAVEAGYFMERGDEALGGQDLLDALAEDVAGNRIYSPQMRNEEMAALRDQLNALDDYLRQLGGDIAMDNAALKAMLLKAAEMPAEGEVTEFGQSATIRAGKETLKKYGLDPGGRYKTRQVAAALEARQRAKYGTIPRDDRSPEAEAKISKWMVEEVLFEMQHPEKSGVGWYSEKFQRALDVFGEIFPELQTDQNARDLVTALIAITSDGQKVVPNFAQAIDTYSNFRETGKFVTSRGHMRQDSITNNLAKIQELHDTLGPEGMRDYLMQEETVSRLKKVAKENGIQFSTDYQAEIKLPMAALVFGPKLGAFYANLMGAHGYLTMDRWWSRTFNRYRGNLLTAPTKEGIARFKELVAADKGLDAAKVSDDEALAFTVEYRDSYEAKGYKGGTEIEKAANTIYKAAFENLEDQPFNATDRTFMLNAVKRAQKTLERRGAGMSIADIQAVLWYYEKRLYGELGAKQTADISYEEAARKVADTYRTGGGDRAERLAALGDGEAADQADAGVVPPGEEDFVEGDGPVTLYQSETPEDRRGFIQFGAERRFTIGLLEKADLSTFIHESGHFWLEVMGDLAERPGVSEQLKADYQTLLDWFGVKSRAEITTEHHEKFARGNEAYLMEGKAPSAELRSIFQRVRAWMSLIYRTLNRLNVQLNDDVRAVFDRIYATDEEIEAAGRQLDVTPIFATAADAGMTEAEFAAYRKTVEAASTSAKEKLQAELMREYQREREKWWKDKRAAVKLEVTAEVDTQPVYVAFATLVDGKLPDGTPLKLSKDDLVRRYGEAYLKRLPRGFQRIYAGKGGSDIDTAAETLGFDSGTALIEALVNMRPRGDLIEAETDARMAREYGDLRLDGSIAEEAMQALHNEERAKILEAELRALRRQQLQVEPVLTALRREERQARATAMDIPPAEVFRAAARGLIGQTQVKDIQPFQYLQAERRASKAAYEAAAKKDYITAATEKQRELMNHYLYLEATKAKEEVDGIYRYMGRFDKDATRQKLAKAGANYLDQIDAILERYEFRKITLRSLGRRQSLLQFVEEMEQQGLLVNVPDQLVDEARRVNYKEAQVDELRAVRDTVKNIEHLANLKDKLLRKQEQLEFEAVKSELIGAAMDNFASTGELGIPNRKGETIRERGARLWKWFDAKHLKVEQVVEWLDGGKINGPWARYVFDLAGDAQTKEYELHAAVTAKLRALSEAMPKAWRDSMTDRMDVSLPGIDGPVTRYTLLSIALNAGNESNFQRLRDGYGWSDDTIAAALAKLSADDARFAQGTWDTVNSLWPEIVALEKRVTGIAPTKVEPRPVMIGGVEVAGGYFPLAYDPRASAVGEKQAEAAESIGQFMANAYGRARTDKGYTKQRVETLKAPVLLDFEQVMTSHMGKVIKDISHREAIYSLNKILKDQDIKRALIDSIGEEQYRELNKWTQTLVADRADTLHQATGMANLVMKFRTNMAIVTMGWKISTMLAQFAGFGPSMDLVKPRYLTQALVDFNRYGPWSSHRQTLQQFVFDKSGEMRFRADTIERDVRDALRRLQGDTSPLAAVRKTAFYLTAMADRQVTIPTWLGAYRQALAEGLNDEDAVRAGDRAVRLSQGAGGVKDLAAVQRDNELMKLLTMYYSPFSVLYARLRDLGHTTRRVQDMPRAVARVMALVIMPAVLGELLTAKGPDEDEDEVWWAIRKTLLYPVASIPVVRDLSGYLEASMINLTGEGEMEFAPNFRLSPVVGAMDKLARLVFLRLPEAIQGTRDWDDVAWDSLEASGYVLGLPTQQVRITGEYITDVLTNQANPESPQQALHDLLFRRPADR